MAITLGDFDEAVEIIQGQSTVWVYEFTDSVDSETRAAGYKLSVEMGGDSTTITPVTTTSGRPARSGSVLGKRGKKWAKLTLTNNSGFEPPAVITRDHAEKFVEFMGDPYCYPGAHRSVMRYQKWRDLHGVSEEIFKVRDPADGLLKNRSLLSVACTGDCGIKLPLQTLTIDHIRSQSKGKYEAIARVFRGFGLTAAGPKGAKNQDAVNLFAASVGGRPIATAVTDTRAMRYKLNIVGKLYLTILRQSKNLDSLKSACMDRYLNLRPMCGPCNSSRGNRDTLNL